MDFRVSDRENSSCFYAACQQIINNWVRSVKYDNPTKIIIY